jgi:hypothetical protein
MIAAAYAVELMVSVFQVKLSRLFSSFNFEYIAFEVSIFYQTQHGSKLEGTF